MYQVGVIGLGSIASRYGTPDEVAPYCHVGGIRHSTKVELAAVADMSEAVRTAFQETWGACFPVVRIYDSSTAMLAGGPLDIAAVCVRGPYHFTVVKEVLESPARSIFLEKPPTCSLQEMDEVVALATQRDVAITVSYSRHWNPRTLRMRELIEGGLIGQVQTVVGYTGGSFLSFASHTTDLICQFAGYCPATVLARGHHRQQEVPEGYQPEPALDNLSIEFKNGVLGVQVGSETEHGAFYVDVFGTQGRARIGMYFEPHAWDEKGKAIDLAAHAMPENASVFRVAYDQIARYLGGGPKADCTDGEYVQVHEIGFAAIESTLTGRRVALPNVERSRRIWADG